MALAQQVLEAIWIVLEELQEYFEEAHREDRGPMLDGLCMGKTLMELGYLMNSLVDVVAHLGLPSTEH